MSRWISKLNPEQAEAAMHDSGPLLILAGAGSGKTTVLVSRAGRLIDERVVDPARLCVLTFTNKAAKELKHRLGNLAEELWAGTFHSFGLQILRRFHKEAGLSREFGILDPGDASGLVKEMIRDFHLLGKDTYDSDKLLSTISRWRERGQTVAERDEEYETATEWLLPKYLKKLELLGMVDFDGLILKPLELMKEIPQIQESFDQVMVDEFQDTNETQMRLVRRLVEPHKNICVVGDDDQSIYGWRGACVSNILDFPKSFPGCKVVRLERNYRSASAILAVANAVIAKNTKRHAKVLRSESGDEGQPPEVFVYADENEEVESVASEVQAFLREGMARHEIAVLYRSNSQGALLEAELRRTQIPYAITGGTAFFDRKEIRDILAFLRAMIKPNEVAYRRILNTPPRGIGEKTIEHLKVFAGHRPGGFVDAVRRWREAGVDEKAGAAIENLQEMIFDGRRDIRSGETLLKFLARIEYRKYLDKIAGDLAANKWRLVEVFARILDRFAERDPTDPLADFVDKMELRDHGESAEDERDKVQLLTLHACKGLEWPVVILMGVEEDMIPHKTLGTDVSEERRLFYVGVTRAKKRLILTRAKRRRRYGKMVECMPSRFLLEIPPKLLVQYEGGRPLKESNRKAMLAELFSKLDAMDKAT